ncbi:E3 ubiquitin-protein ligase PPP1R11-like [Dermacentor andersoni]|uniref:E3 ubiquitin-protein ligase PPP1R11-like n=1 Tax=Dermacentor andersoni TaxID=34620 RepID=UPI00215591AA|nr:E3 ubiquitin-protein ligase PPP1R11-like [Dermacentor andersoni]
MADASTRQRESAASGSVTQHLNPDQAAPAEKPLKITKKKSKQGLRRVVSWTTETVDNENLNRKSSKCCCIYVKPTKFGEDSEEDVDEGDCENCRGHFPKGRRFHKDVHKDNPHAGNADSVQRQPQNAPLPAGLGPEHPPR